MRVLVTFLLLILLAWVGLRRLEQASLYFPDRQIIMDPHQAGMPFEAIDLITSDGARIHAWWISSGNRRIDFCRKKELTKMPRRPINT